MGNMKNCVECDDFLEDIWENVEDVHSSLDLKSGKTTR